MRIEEGITAWHALAPSFAERGIYLPDARAVVPKGTPISRDYKAMYAAQDAVMAADSMSGIVGFDEMYFATDAQPTLQTLPNSGIPWFLSNFVDPAVYQILFAANKAAKIFGERRSGTWVDTSAMFPTVEHEGEVSSYGDYNENGHTGANTNWPNRQAYLYQTIKEYGELEIARAGLGRVNWVQELDAAAAMIMDKFQNLSYFYGIDGLENYGALNDPNLSAAITPSPKAYGGTQWIVNGVVKATPNEVYTDIQSLYSQLVSQTNGLIDQETKMVLALSPASSVAITGVNNFNVDVTDQIKKNFPNIRIETAVQYGAASATNNQGYQGGNFVQLIAESIEGQQTAYCAYNEKYRAHAIVKGLSSFRQKMTGGTWGIVIRMPIGIAGMVGI